MVKKYYSVLTSTGIAEIASAEVGGTKVSITHIALGDGNGALITPDEGMLALNREIARVAISRVYKHPENLSWLVFEAVVPADQGGWTIREIGLIGGGGKLLSVGNFPTTYKPTQGEGAIKDLMIRMIVQISNASVVELIVDPSTVIASSQTVTLAIQNHEAAANPHPEYLTRAEGDVRYRNPGRYFFGQF